MPADFAPLEIAPQLATRWLGENFVFEKQVDSTNSYVDRLARSGAAHGAVVVADCQTQGRGRLQRTWCSPPGVNLYVSILLRPSWDVQASPRLSLAAGVALAEAIEALLGQPPVLKWPNDVLHEGRKLAGILVEASTEGRKVKHVVLGFGLNVNQMSFSDELSDRASSLRLASGRALDRGDVLGRVLGRLEHWIDALEHQPESIVARWQDFAPWLGGPVKIVRNGRVLDGIALDVESSGALRVQDAAGEIHVVLAGDALPEPCP